MLQVSKDHLYAGRYREAIEDISMLLDHDPNNSEGLFVRGTASIELGEFESARTDLARAALAKPDEPRFQYNLALAERCVGNTERARSLCLDTIGRFRFGPAYHLLSAIDLGGDLYYDVLRRFVEQLAPRTYLEIGVFQGQSLRLLPVSVKAIGVDPDPQLTHPVGPNQMVFKLTSDEFFASQNVRSALGGLPVDLAFIDGMHHFDFALRDFINIERLCHPGSVILIHDCFPMDEISAERDRETAFWSGDIWRLILILKKYRPDLVVRTLKSPPTGLGMIVNLDPSSRVLSDNLETIIAEFMEVKFQVLGEHKHELLNAMSDDWEAVAALLPHAGRSQ